VDRSTNFLSASEGDIYEIDLVLAGVMVRSYGLLDGFLDAINASNPVVAAPLVRLQIDNLVRVSYMVHAPSASDVARHIVSGGEFRTWKDAEGRKLTDARRLEHAEEFHPWVRRVYAATSGWVHFSPEHVRAAVQIEHGTPDATSGTFIIRVPLPAGRIPVSAFEELLGAMAQATEELFAYLELWEQRKGLPLGEMRALTQE
jgi:hypothetical protein